MSDDLYEGEISRWRAALVTAQLDPGFEDIWPSDTAGDGLVKSNNANTGDAQGKGSLLRKAACQLCGFPNDLSAIDHSGGSADGNGAGSTIATSTVSAPVSGGGTHTEPIGTQSASRGAGCALCFSKNSTSQREQIETTANPWSQVAPLGF